MTHNTDTADGAQPLNHLSSADVAALKAVVGDFDPTQGLKPSQQSILSVGMYAGAMQQMPDFANLFTDLWEAGHFTVQAPTDHAADNAAAFRIWTANSLKIILDQADTTEFLAFIRSLRGKEHDLKGFAGAHCPLHKLQAANVWYELNFPAGNYPGVVPVRDAVDENTKIVRVKRMAIHVIHANCVNPFPMPDSPLEIESKIANDPLFLRTGTVTAYIEDALGTIYTFSGILAYGFSDGTSDGSQGGRPGSAIVWRVSSVDQHLMAMHGQDPSGKVIPLPISGLAQFSLGTLAYLIRYFIETGEGDYMTFAARYRQADGVAEPTDDAVIDYTGDTAPNEKERQT